MDKGRRTSWSDLSLFQRAIVLTICAIPAVVVGSLVVLLVAWIWTLIAAL
jgi:hypothetical protein